jgi:hypothetical protein
MGETAKTVHIKKGEKVFFVASTGWGKTVFARKLLTGLANNIIVDPKHEFSWSDTGTSRYDYIFTDLPSLREWRGPNPAIYRPDITDLQNGCNDFFQFVWKLRTPRVYIDELLDLCPTGRASYWLQKCIKQGRSRGLSIWSGTQRPTGIPLELISESKHFFVGGLLMPQDRKRMAEIAHPDVAKQFPEPFTFFYTGVANRELRTMNANDIIVVER